MPMVLLAIGSNLGRFGSEPPLATCKEAVAASKNVAGLHLQALSRWYETAPMPPSGQPNYVNGVARLDGTVDPEQLLRALQAIEQAFGRQRSVPNAARTLDLDIIAIGDLVRSGPDPILPHPRMHERAFVLQPLLDVAPDWCHPVTGQPARALLSDLPPQAIRALPPSHLREDGPAPI